MTFKTDKIASFAKNLHKSVVIEVGSGPGSLTRSLLQNGAKHLIAIEKDSRFLSALQGLQQAVPDRLHIVHGDVLQIDEAQIIKPFCTENRNDIVIIGNLPFNIATPLLLKWLKMISQKQQPFSGHNNVSMFLLFQSEVGKVCSFISRYLTLIRELLHLQALQNLIVSQL